MKESIFDKKMKDPKFKAVYDEVVKEDASMTKKLEPRNFRINSDGWKLKDYGNVTCKVNPKGDVAEYVSGVSKELVGEQLFTWDAAMRETKKAGKRMPTKEEWEEVKDEVVGCGVYPGCLNFSDGVLGGRGVKGRYWSSTQYNATYGYALFFYSTGSDVYDYNKAYGFSVRCLSDRAELEVPVLSIDEISEIISKSELTRLALLPWTERSLSAIEFDKKIKTIAEAIIKAREAKRRTNV